MTFHEKQRFTQPWLWVLLVITGISVCGSLVYAFYQQIILGKPAGDRPMSDGALIVLTIFILSLMTLLFLMFIFGNLSTVIDDKGIRIRFSPFHRKYRNYPWDSIQSCTVTRYRPIAEYGGWGIRYGTHGMAYNVRGNMGLQIIFKNGKQKLIGTQKAEEMEAFLKAVGK